MQSIYSYYIQVAYKHPSEFGYRFNNIIIQMEYIRVYVGVMTLIRFYYKYIYSIKCNLFDFVSNVKISLQ